MTGTLHVVRNGEATYYLVADDGEGIQLLFADAADLDSEELEALDRLPVTVVGIEVSENVMQVTWIGGRAP